MSTTEIRKRLINYIETAEERKVKALYTVVEGDIQFDDIWEDKAFLKDIIKRTKEMESGKVKTYTHAEMKEGMRKALQAAKKR